jgi:hypothetical protein
MRRKPQPAMPTALKQATRVNMRVAKSKAKLEANSCHPLVGGEARPTLMGRCLILAIRSRNWRRTLFQKLSTHEAVKKSSTRNYQSTPYSSLHSISASSYIAHTITIVPWATFQTHHRPLSTIVPWATFQTHHRPLSHISDPPSSLEHRPLSNIWRNQSTNRPTPNLWRAVAKPIASPRATQSNAEQREKKFYPRIFTKYYSPRFGFVDSYIDWNWKQGIGRSGYMHE